jgi:hypothetical protein
MRRRRLLFSFSVALTTLVAGTRPVRATEPPPAAEPAPALGGLHLLLSGGYGVSTNDVRKLKLSPYGPSLGLNAGFTFRFGLHLGAYFDYSLGRDEKQTYDPVLGKPIEFTADTSSINGGLTLGYDVPLHGLLLRYSLALGVTSMKWDFGPVDASDLRYGDAKNPSVGLHFAPGALLLVPLGSLEAGVGFDYFVQANGTIPDGFLGKAVFGVKL